MQKCGVTKDGTIVFISLLGILSLFMWAGLTIRRKWQAPRFLILLAFRKIVTGVSRSAALKHGQLRRRANTGNPSGPTLAKPILPLLKPVL